MSKHNNCDELCCHQIECCPRGFIEQVKNYRYMRWATAQDGGRKTRFFEYWWHHFKSLIGFNNASRRTLK